KTLPPHPHLPKLEPPRGTRVSSEESTHQSSSPPEKFTLVDMMKLIRQSGNAISKRLSLLHKNDGVSETTDVTEFEISGVKVLVKLKSEEELRGRITFFSRSNCRDSTAVRSFFRERGFDFSEINIDVYTHRERELVERTGSSQVPQIFFNEKHFGGLMALNSLRNSGGEFDRRIKELLAEKCCDDAAPAPVMYGFDEEEEEGEGGGGVDEMMRFVRVLRQKLPIKDRLMKMKIVKNCFSGGEMVEILIHHLDCGRKQAVEIGKKLAKKHFIHHVLGENDFEDGDHYYRFLEHEPFISNCYNFRGSTNDMEPPDAVMVGQKLFKIMTAILESYSSDDHSRVDYLRISQSEEFRRYLNLVQDLQRMNLLEFSTDEKLAFFLNLYNAMVIHALIRIGRSDGMIARRSFFTEFQYVVGGYAYSLKSIRNNILRGGQSHRQLYPFIKPFMRGNTHHELVLQKLNPLVHFGLCDGTISSPVVMFFTPQGVESELKRSAREFFQNGGIEVILEKRVVHLSRIIKWYKEDFSEEKKLLKWIMSYVDANKAGLLTHLLGDGRGSVNIVYQDYDWSINS
ncbi:F261 protein, partial [Hirschfeldia incana]